MPPWWTGRRITTAFGEQGTILDRGAALRWLSRKTLRRMILAKDYLEVVKWDDGGLELVHEDYLADEETHIGQPAEGLISWARLMDAPRRSLRTVAAVGLIICLVGSVAELYGYPPSPPVYQASITFLVDPSTVWPNLAGSMREDEILSRNPGNARLLMKLLGLKESISRFFASYTVTPLSSQLLQITVTAATSRVALREAAMLKCTLDCIFVHRNVFVLAGLTATGEPQDAAKAIVAAAVRAIDPVAIRGVIVSIESIAAYERAYRASYP